MLSATIKIKCRTNYLIIEWINNAWKKKMMMWRMYSRTNLLQQKKEKKIILKQNFHLKFVLHPFPAKRTKFSLRSWPSKDLQRHSSLVEVKKAIKTKEKKISTAGDDNFLNLLDSPIFQHQLPRKSSRTNPETPPWILKLPHQWELILRMHHL